MSSLETSVARFIAKESFLLNDCQWQDWLELFDEQGFYWIPAHPEQTDPINHVSHIYESASLRELRIRRFQDANALSFKPSPRMIRHTSNLYIEPGAKGNQITARATLLAAQYAYGSVQQFHATTSWVLNKHGESYRIVMKRVDLLNSDGWLSDILHYL